MLCDACRTTFELLTQAIAMTATTSGNVNKTVRLVVVMDPISDIKPAKDTTLAMLLAAQSRGWQLWYAEQGDLWLRDGVPMARLRPVTVKNDLQDWYQLGESQIQGLAEFDVILMRK